MAVAAVLHYFFLVAFATMLVNNANLCWKAFSFVRGKRGDSTQDILINLLLAWGKYLQRFTMEIQYQIHSGDSPW